MPYITQARRAGLRWNHHEAATAGELNWAITEAIEDYRDRVGTDSYQLFNDIIGALEGAKLEFYRRVVAPYEDVKCVENGDVYTPSTKRRI